MRKHKRVYHPVLPKEAKPHRVKQEFRDEVNINTVISRMKKGISPPSWMTSNTPRYGDFTDGPQTYMEAFAVIERAEAAFLGLPVEMRRAIDHDPSRISEIPREMYEQFGLLNKRSPDERPGTPGASAGDRKPEGQGDRDLPVERPQGAKKGSPKESPVSDE